MAVFNCLASSGGIIYPVSSGGGGGGPGGWPPGGGYGGGMGGGGGLWSGSAQLIWIIVNNAPKYPVWLKPGWNEVRFWIPFIFPDEEWVEATIIIEAPGYLLIPAGFEFYIKTDEDAPVRTGNPKMADKLKFIDLYDIEIESVPVPVDLDNLIDEIVFEDTHSIDIIAISNIVDEACIENLTIEDINDYDIQGEPFSGEYEHVDELVFNDVTNTELINATVNNQTESESIGFDDFVDID